MLYTRIENWLPSTKTKKSLKFITFNFHFLNITDKYHSISSLGKVRNDINPYHVSTRCYIELGPLHTLSYLNLITTQ